MGRVYYFSAYATHLNDQAAVDRHKLYVRCLEDSGVVTVLGNFKEKDATCPLCQRPFIRHEEKRTDVAIATQLLVSLMSKECENIVVISGDTDLIPAIEGARRLASSCKIFVVFPYKRQNNELSKLFPGAAFKLNQKTYMAHQFSDPYVLRDGTNVSKPASW